MSIYEEIRAERARQDAKFGANRVMPASSWLPVLVEEVGEVGSACLDDGQDAHGDLRAELVQVAAVAVAWLESIDNDPRR